MKTIEAIKLVEVNGVYQDGPSSYIKEYMQYPRIEPAQYTKEGAPPNPMEMVAAVKITERYVKTNLGYYIIEGLMDEILAVVNEQMKEKIKELEQSRAELFRAELREKEQRQTVEAEIRRFNDIIAKMKELTEKGVDGMRVIDCEVVEK